MDWPFGGLSRGGFGVVYADPPWSYKTWSAKGTGRSAEQHYSVMSVEDIMALPVGELAKPDCVLFMWATWPTIQDAFRVIEAWGFTYKTCAFDWMKADVSTIDLFPDPKDASISLGHWTRSNSEPCLLATKGKPKRLDAGVKMGIIEPRREHSRKPSVVYDRIERLVAGPYCEIFSRTTRPGWSCWGKEVGKFVSEKTTEQTTENAG
jgi:N6-adenosine-specific RNA methylase IME4